MPRTRHVGEQLDLGVGVGLRLSPDLGIDRTFVQTLIEKSDRSATPALIRTPFRADETQIPFGIRDGAILMITDLEISRR